MGAVPPGTCGACPRGIYQGNTYPNSVYIDAKPVPGTDEVIGIDSPGHGQPEHVGALSVIATKGGPDNRANVKHLREENRYCDPWAFSRDLFMATDGRTVKLFNRHGRSCDWFSLPESFGDRCRLYEPRPLMPHARERLQADRTDLTRKTGEFYLENVLIGRTMAGVKPGTVKKLMVLEVLPRPISYTGGMDPISCGGTFSLERLPHGGAADPAFTFRGQPHLLLVQDRAAAEALLPLHHVQSHAS